MNYLYKTTRSFLILSLLLGALPMSARAAELVIEHLSLQENGPIPKMTSWVNPQSKETELLIVDDANQKLIFEGFSRFERSFPTRGASSSVQVDSSSTYFGICQNLGTRLSVGSTATKKIISTVDFVPPNGDWSRPNPLYDYNCYDAVIELKNGRLVAWLGSAGNRKIALIDIGRKQILQTFQVSGPFVLKKIGSIMFTVNGLIFSNASLPYIFHSETGKTLVGNAMGEETPKLERKFSSWVFDDSKVSGWVFYAQPDEKVFYQFDAQNPSIKSVRLARLSIEQIRDMSRYKQCLVAVGWTLSENLPHWSVLKQEPGGAFAEIKTFRVNNAESLKNVRFQQISQNGDLSVTHLGGTSRLVNFGAEYLDSDCSKP